MLTRSPADRLRVPLPPAARVVGAAALADIDPESARLLAAILVATKALLRHLGQDQDDAAEPDPAVPAPQAARPRRRGLGHGWQGVRIPSAER